MKQGFTIRKVPEHTERVCNGCEYLNTQAGVRGHYHVTNNFACNHPDNTKDYGRSIFGITGKIIHLNHEGYCDTPSWCPFLKPKKDEKENAETTGQP